MLGKMAVVVTTLVQRRMPCACRACCMRCTIACILLLSPINLVILHISSNCFVNSFTSATKAAPQPSRAFAGFPAYCFIAYFNNTSRASSTSSSEKGKSLRSYVTMHVHFASTAE